MHTDFSCPACSADLDVRERLDEHPTGGGAQGDDRRTGVNSNLLCPACSVELEVRERLVPADVDHCPRR